MDTAGRRRHEARQAGWWQDEAIMNARPDRSVAAGNGFQPWDWWDENFPDSSHIFPFHPIWPVCQLRIGPPGAEILRSSPILSHSVPLPTSVPVLQAMIPYSTACIQAIFSAACSLFKEPLPE